MGIFAAIWRIISFQNLRQGHKLKRVGDEVFTKDVDGRRAAYAVSKQKKIQKFKDFFDAVSQAELAVKQKETILKNLQATLVKTKKALQGAANAYNTAKDKNDTAAMEQAAADGTKYKGELAVQEEQESKLKAEIAAKRKDFSRLERILGEMREEIANLPAEEAESITNFLSDTAFIEAQEKISGILSTEDADPVDAVREADALLRSKAEVMGNLSHQNGVEQRDAYIRAAEGEEAQDDFLSFAAASKAEKASKTGVAAPVEDERTKF